MARGRAGEEGWGDWQQSSVARCPRCHELTVLGPDGGGIDEELKPSVMLRNAVRRYTALKYRLPPRLETCPSFRAWVF